MATPSRKRSNDEESAGFFSRLFSSSKKRRTVTDDSVHTNTTQLPYMELNPVSSPMVTNDTSGKAQVQTARGADVIGNSVVIGAPNSAVKNEFKLTLGLETNRIRKRRKRYKPNAKTLMARKEKRQNTSIYNNDEEIINRLLQQNKNLFTETNSEESQSLFSTTGLSRFVQVRRKFGVNQNGSRYPKKEISELRSFEEHKKKKQVSFNAMHTPKQKNDRPRLSRKQTPGPGQSVKAAYSSPSTSLVSSDKSDSSKLSASSKSSCSSQPSTPSTVYKNDMNLHLDNNFLFDGPEKGSPEIISESNDIDHKPMQVDHKLRGKRQFLQNVKERSLLFKREKKSVSKKTPNVVIPDKESPSNGGPIPKKSKWDASMFAANKNTWKCPTCNVFVDNKFLKCQCCETPKPGVKSSEAENGTSSTAAAGSISEGGFKFGGNAAAVNAPVTKDSKFFSSSGGGSGNFSFGATDKAGGTGNGFSFGSDKTTAATSAKDGNSAGGFSFGSDKTTVATSAKDGNSAGGFSFGSDKTTVATSAKDGNSVGGFSFGSDKTTAATPAKDGNSVGGFSFGAPKTTATAPEQDGGGGFSFGAPKTIATAPEKSGDIASEAPKTKKGFSFGTPKESKPSIGNKAFSFGAPAQSISPSTTILDSRKNGVIPPAQGAMKQDKNINIFGKGDSLSTSTQQKEEKSDIVQPNAVATNTMTNGVSQLQKEKATSKFNFGAPTGNLPLPNLDSTKNQGGFQFGTGISQPAQNMGKQNMSFGNANSLDKPGVDEERKKKRRSLANEESMKSMPSPAPKFTFGKPDASTGANSIASTGAATASGSKTPKPFVFGSQTSSVQATPSGNISITGQSSSVNNPFAGKTTVPTPGTSTSFSFGTKKDEKSTGPDTTFGKNNATFGSIPPQNTASSTNTSFSFGAPKTPAPAPSTFGSNVSGQAANTPATVFGSTQTPAATNTFGASTPSTFGTTTNQSFGAPQAAAPAGVTFGTPSVPTTNSTFGAPPVQPVNNGFGAAPAPTPAFSFGQPTPSQSTFGNNQAPSNGFNTSNTTNSFGAPSFGANPTTPGIQAQNTPGGFNIGVGGSKSTGKRSGRRILRAKRPPGSANR